MTLTETCARAREFDVPHSVAFAPRAARALTIASDALHACHGEGHITAPEPEWCDVCQAFASMEAELAG